jgi:transcriptional antiterminator
MSRSARTGDTGSMAVHIPLDSRQSAIARHLLQAAGPLSVEGVAGALGLTTRMVRYDLRPVAEYLAAYQARLVRRRGLGVWVEVDPSTRGALLAGLDDDAGVDVLSAGERQHRALAILLDRAPEPTHLAELEGALGASRATVRRDVRSVEPWLEEHHLHLQRVPGIGLVVRGSELDVRKGLLALLVASPTPELLLPGSLDLPLHRSIIVSHLPRLDDGGPMLAVATLYLAIITRRIRGGRRAALQSGQLRSLIDHPVTDAAERIAADLESRTRIVMGEAETAAITEFLLGFVELEEADGRPELDRDTLIDRLVRTAAERLHPSLAEDDQLRRSLAEHVRRLRIRLRYGLPVSNPLDDEVRHRYPDVYAVATETVQEVGSIDEAAIPPDEVGYLAMYLAGSLERNRLRPKIRVAVVCPAGMATAWILVSRLLAVFPQVDVTRVVSKSVYERDASDADVDVVVSTVPVEDESSLPTVVVSPLLRDGDVRRLSRLLGEPTR